MIGSKGLIKPGAQDWFNYIAAELNCNYQLNCVMELDCYIDKEIINKAIHLLLIEQPILASRFVTDGKEAHWQVRPELKERDFCTVIPTVNSEEDVLKFVNRPIHEGVDPLFDVCVYRGQATDTLCIKISHSCADGRGTKDFVERLNKIYNRLVKDRSFHTREKNGTRAQAKLFQEVTRDELSKSLFTHSAQDSIGCRFPYISQESEKGNSSLVVKYMEKDEFRRIRSIAKKYGATVNDLFIAALFRANWNLDNLSEKQKTSIGCTADLRQYLPEREMDTICNLSSVFEIVAQKNLTGSFGDTLQQVVKETKKLKEAFLGADFPFTYEVLSRIGFDEMYRHITSDQPENGSPFIFSNLGVIGSGKMTWGPASVRRFYVTGPALNPPMSLVVATTYDDVVAFTFAYSSLSVTEKLADAYLELVLEELKSC